MTAERKDDLLRVLMLAFAALRAVNYFYVSTALHLVSAAIILTVIGLSVPRLKGKTGLVIAVMAAIGVLLMIVSGASPKQWLAALLKNGNLVMLLTLAPMLSRPFFYEDYQGELKVLAKARMRDLVSFLLLLTLSSHMLGVLVSIGAVIIVYDLLHPFGELYKAEMPFVTTITRGYSSSGFWSPAWASAIVYSQFPDVKWTRVIPVAILFTVLFNGISLGSFAIMAKRDPGRWPRLEPEEGVRPDRRKLWTMLALFAGMIGSIVLVESLTGWDLMLCVPVAALLFPLAAAAVQNKWPAYREGVGTYYEKNLMKIPMQAALYATAGFLGKALELSGIGDAVARLIPSAFIQYPPLMVLSLIVLMTIPGFFGIHPVATGSAMVATLIPSSLGLTNYTFALTILYGWIMAVMLNPLSAQTLILSGESGRSNLDVSIRSNWLFCLVCTILFSLLIPLFGGLLG